MEKIEWIRRKLSDCVRRFTKKSQRTMKVSGIDKDFVNIIDVLNKEGFRPFASCDGVDANHSEDNLPPINAYIAFLKSPRIIDLMAVLMRDKDTFKITISNNTHMHPYYLYGNLIYGNMFSVYFENSLGQATQYFEKIITEFIAGRIEPTREERQVVSKLVRTLDKDKRSDLLVSVILNNTYQPYMNKSGRINVLSISTKSGCEYNRDITGLLDEIAEKYGIVKKDRAYGTTYDEDEFIASSGDTECEIYLRDEHLDLIGQLIKDIREIGRSLPYCKKQEPDYNYGLIAEEPDEYLM